MTSVRQAKAKYKRDHPRCKDCAHWSPIGSSRAYNGMCEFNKDWDFATWWQWYCADHEMKPTTQKGGPR